MKQLLLFVLLALAFIDPCHAKGIPDYDISGAGTATQGNYIVNVNVYSKNKKLTNRDLVSAAVHGVLFRGFSNESGRGSQKPLAGSAANEAQHQDFYDVFFGKDGSAGTFGNVVDGSRTLSKTEKGYRTHATVLVRKEELLKHLEAAGVVAGLNSIF